MAYVALSPPPLDPVVREYSAAFRRGEGGAGRSLAFAWNGGVARSVDEPLARAAFGLARGWNDVDGVVDDTAGGTTVVSVGPRSCDTWPDGHVTREHLEAVLDAAESVVRGVSTEARRVPAASLPAVADLCDYLDCAWAVEGPTRLLLSTDSFGVTTAHAAFGLASDIVRADVASRRRRRPRCAPAAALWSAAAGVVRMAGGLQREEVRRAVLAADERPPADDVLDLVGSFASPPPGEDAAGRFRWLLCDDATCRLLARAVVDDIEGCDDARAARAALERVAAAFVLNAGADAFASAVAVETLGGMDGGSLRLTDVALAEVFRFVTRRH